MLLFFLFYSKPGTPANRANNAYNRIKFPGHADLPLVYQIKQKIIKIKGGVEAYFIKPG